MWTLRPSVANGDPRPVPAEGDERRCRSRIRLPRRRCRACTVPAVDFVRAGRITADRGADAQQGRPSEPPISEFSCAAPEDRCTARQGQGLDQVSARRVQRHYLASGARPSRLEPSNLPHGEVRAQRASNHAPRCSQRLPDDPSRPSPAGAFWSPRGSRLAALAPHHEGVDGFGRHFFGGLFAYSNSAEPTGHLRQRSSSWSACMAEAFEKPCPRRMLGNDREALPNTVAAMRDERHEGLPRQIMAGEEGSDHRRRGHSPDREIRGRPPRRSRYSGPSP